MRDNFYINACEQAKRWIEDGKPDNAKKVLELALRGEKSYCPKCPKDKQETLFGDDNGK